MRTECAPPQVRMHGTLTNDIPTIQTYRRPYLSIVDYWLAYANTELESIYDTDFGDTSKIQSYGHMCSLIPVESCACTSPRISAVIDWEFCTFRTSSFSKYPLFIVYHPIWKVDHPIRAQNIRDQATFNSLMLEAERKKDPIGNLPLSHAFARCQGVYFF